MDEIVTTGMVFFGAVGGIILGIILALVLSCIPWSNLKLVRRIRGGRWVKVKPKFIPGTSSRVYWEKVVGKEINPDTRIFSDVIETEDYTKKPN